MQTNMPNQAEMARTMMSLNSAKPESDINSKEELLEVAEQFESLFMNMMLKSMRAANASISEGNYFDSFESKMYRDMLDEKLSVQLSGRHALGISDLLVQQLTPKVASREYDFVMGKNNGEDSTRQSMFSSPASFVESLLPQAEAAADALGVDPRIVIAQAALETGWGKHVMTDGAGKNSHNLFGIKANSEWRGDTISIDSIEIENGVAVQEKSSFKAYASYEDAMTDYANLLKSNERYQNVMNSGSDVDKFGAGLKRGGYATDPDYNKKLSQVMNHESLSSHNGAKTLEDY